MTHARDRQYSKAQMAMLVAIYILQHGSISIADVRRITGGSWWQAYRLLLAMDGVLPVYCDEGRRVLLQRDELTQKERR